jgi:hypothetical protein
MCGLTWLQFADAAIKAKAAAIFGNGGKRLLGGTRKGQISLPLLFLSAKLRAPTKGRS